MNFIPVHKETLVSELSPDALINRLSISTSQMKDRSIARDNVLFQGSLDEEHFRISQQLKQPNNFIPLIDGEVEPTSHGCLIFVTYKLFFSSFMFLSFWTVTSLAMTLYLVLTIQHYVYGALSLALGILNYVITLVNFRKQVGISRSLLLNALNIDE